MQRALCVLSRSHLSDGLVARGQPVGRIAMARAARGEQCEGLHQIVCQPGGGAGHCRFIESTVDTPFGGKHDLCTAKRPHRRLDLVLPGPVAAVADKTALAVMVQAVFDMQPLRRGAGESHVKARLAVDGRKQNTIRDRLARVQCGRFGLEAGRFQGILGKARPPGAIPPELLARYAVDEDRLRDVTMRIEMGAQIRDLPRQIRITQIDLSGIEQADLSDPALPDPPFCPETDPVPFAGMHAGLQAQIRGPSTPRERDPALPSGLPRGARTDRRRAPFARRASAVRCFHSGEDATQGGRDAGVDCHARSPVFARTLPRLSYDVKTVLGNISDVLLTSGRIVATFADLLFHVFAVAIRRQRKGKTMRDPRDFDEMDIRGADGSVLLLHHATRADFDIVDLAPFSHFGSRAAAKARHPGVRDVRLISAFVMARRPIHVPDFNDTHDPHSVARLLFDIDPDTFAGLPSHLDALGGMDDAVLWEEIARSMDVHGYDALVYRNHHEDPGSISVIVPRRDQLVVVRDGPAHESMDAWDLTEADFVGPAMVDDNIFAISTEDDAIAMALDALRDSAVTLRRSADGTQIRWIDYWEPEGTVGLVDCQGVPRGVYTGGCAWIDPAFRGNGHAVDLILTAADLVGGNPARNEKGLGFTVAGHAAHVAAHRKAVAYAIEQGLIDAPCDAAPA